MKTLLARFAAFTKKSLSSAASFAARFLFIKLPIPVGVLLLLLLATAASAVYGVKRNPELIGLLKGPADIAREEREFIAEVNRSITLPQDEKPNIATITDLDKLAEQPFFKNAKKGDKILMFSNAKKVILYRPSEKRVIEVGSVNINQQPEVAGDQAEAEQPATPSATPTKATPTSASTPTPTPEK